jgi:hypothetical protein
MGYLHIENLYKNQLILMFRECYALEKIHGTSAHITFKTNPSNRTQWQVTFFPGGENYNKFVSLFEKDKLLQAFLELGIDCEKEVIIYGEAYGGSQQGMSHTYGPKLKFIVFDVQIGTCWLNVPDAEDFVKKLGLEFVHYVKVSLVKATMNDLGILIVETSLSSIDQQRDACSVQSVRNGITTPEDYMAGKGKKREGVVLRPLIEVTLNNGDRIICKHKGEEFRETATPRPVVDPAKAKVMDDANAIANEWCTATRLQHVLDKLPGHCMERMRDIIAAMQEDVLREAKGEIIESEAVKKAIGKKAVDLYKSYLKSQICQKSG